MELLRLEIRNGYVSGTVTVLKKTQCVVCTNARLMHTLGFRRRCVFLFTRIKHLFNPLQRSVACAPANDDICRIALEFLSLGLDLKCAGVLKQVAEA